MFRSDQMPAKIKQNGDSRLGSLKPLSLTH